MFLNILEDSGKITRLCCELDRQFGIVVSTSDCHPRGPGFDSRLYPRTFSGTGSTRPHEDNWVVT